RATRPRGRAAAVSPRARGRSRGQPRRRCLRLEHVTSSVELEGDRVPALLPAPFLSYAKQRGQVVSIRREQDDHEAQPLVAVHPREAVQCEKPAQSSGILERRDFELDDLAEGTVAGDVFRMLTGCAVRLTHTRQLQNDHAMPLTRYYTATTLDGFIADPTQSL